MDKPRLYWPRFVTGVGVLLMFATALMARFEDHLRQTDDRPIGRTEAVQVAHALWVSVIRAMPCLLWAPGPVLWIGGMLWTESVRNRAGDRNDPKNVRE